MSQAEDIIIDDLDVLSLYLRTHPKLKDLSESQIQHYFRMINGKSLKNAIATIASKEEGRQINLIAQAKAEKIEATRLRRLIGITDSSTFESQIQQQNAKIASQDLAIQTLKDQIQQINAGGTP